jgi:hypothetical protein
MHRIGFFCTAAVPAAVLVMRLEHAPDYVAILPGVLIGMGILGLIQKRRCATPHAE